MTILPSQINDMLRLYSRFSSANSSLSDDTLPPVKKSEDAVDISTEAKKQEIHDQTKMEVMKKIKEIGIVGKERV
ncbi:hypothetical protein MNBD_NITROSPIRAE03-719 [hydrothermal vent metagenome]|uniref:Uncharacterized protein n=1 Tax=hydrothermal vent metagenome TaxID=652676 RepID=A0A3B1CI93_9ZZZZ